MNVSKLSSHLSRSFSHWTVMPPLFVAPPMMACSSVKAQQNVCWFGLTRCVLTIWRSAPLVPMETATSPGNIAPLPRLASWPSADPMMHGNFGEMPMVCATCLLIGGSCVVGETMVLSCVCLTLQMSSASSSHVFVLSLYMQVVSAMVWSVSRFPNHL